ncbi:protease complex subunit PrcB family protein [Brotaphodocola sp.]|uniref:protease complex subunit PrcB family protein n=1 Tax=Brotaphodocola sp. TaxID=3073577 RepID=UPI003D7C67DC
MKKGGNLLLTGCLILWVLVVHVMTGCSVTRENKDKVRDLDFTVTAAEELPEELRKLTEEKKTSPFKLTYTNDGGLYIAVGYGEQPSGGYSIVVNELYLTENAIVIDTELKGPESAEESGTEKSYPYVVVQTEYLEQPVIFQ